MSSTDLTIPGVYRRERMRDAGFPRERTDVIGFVGAAGPDELHEAHRIDDWRDYVETYLRESDGSLREPPPGSKLAASVRAFFANGGARCWVVNVAARIEESRADELLAHMLGLRLVGDAVTGLELLLRQPEVSLLALPEMFAEVTVPVDRVAHDLPPRFEDSEFHRCDDAHGDAEPPGDEPPAFLAVGRLFRDDRVLDIQRTFLDRCAREGWRVFALLAPPPGQDPEEAIRWRRRLGHHDCAAIYWPWLLVQERPGAEVELQSPVGAVAGVYARKDIAEGPHFAPANEPLFSAVGLESVVGDVSHAKLYRNAVNVLRDFTGSGIDVWGARTLLYDEFGSPGSTRGTAFVNVRRCLTAIERTALRVGAPAVFEPNGPMLRLALSQALWSYLLTVFESGALHGQRPEEGFFVRCDAALNPRESIEAGKLVCEIGVAVAGPAEFVVFRLGRKEGVIELEEV